LFICNSPLTLVPSPGTTPKADDFHTQQSDDFLDVDSLEVVNFHSHSCSDLNGTGQAAHASGQVHVTLQHPLPSCGHPYMGGLVLGGLVQ
jgi:hypothetical protein